MSRLLLAALCMSASLIQPSVAEQGAAGRQQFRTEVEVVQLNIVALDQGRRPVRDLTASDFVVLEAGREQTIVNFSVVTMPLWAKSAPQIVSSDIASNQVAASGRLIVIVLDDLLIDDQAAANRTKEIGQQIVYRMAPGDLGAVVFPRNNHESQLLTSDRPRLLAAVAKFTTGPGASDLHARNALDTLANVVQGLAGAPERRKLVVYVSGGVGFDPAAIASPVAMGRFDDRQGRMTVYLQKMRDLWKDAQKEGINIYAIDPFGLTVGPGGGDPRRLSREFLQVLSANTGAVAVVNTNEFRAGIEAVFAETEVFYLLAYQRETLSTRSVPSRPQIRVKRSDVTILTRSEHGAAKPSVTSPKENVRSTIDGVLPQFGFPITVTAAPFAVAQKRQAAIAIALSVGLEPNTNIASPPLELLAAAYDLEGKPRASRWLTVPPGKSRMASTTGLDLVTRLDVAPGRYQLRIGVRDTESGKAGSVFYDIDVPDFSNARLSISGVVLTIGGEQHDPGPADILPVRPTVLRSFDRSRQVAAFFRVYLGATTSRAAVETSIRVKDESGLVQWELKGSLDNHCFGQQKSLDCRISLPLAELSEGAHTLTIAAEMGTTSVSRSLPFEVSK